MAVEIHIPSESELADILVIDLLQRAEALLAVSAAVAHPVAGIIVSVDEPRGVHVGRRGRFLCGRGRIGSRVAACGTHERESYCKDRNRFPPHGFSGDAHRYRICASEPEVKKELTTAQAKSLDAERSMDRAPDPRIMMATQMIMARMWYS